MALLRAQIFGEIKSAASHPVVRKLVVIVAAPLMALCLVDLVNTALIGSDILGFEAEGSALTIATAAAFGAGGIAAALAAVKNARFRFAWAALSALGFMFAAEEVSLGLHEKVEAATSVGVGLLLAGSVGIVIVAVLGAVVRKIPAPAPILLGSGAAILVGAQGSAVLANLAGRVSALGQETFALIEECGEVLVAGSLILAALVFLSTASQTTATVSEPS